MIRLYGHPLSGHCHRVEALLAMLELPYEHARVDLVKGAHRAPEFVALNPFGQVPVIDDDGTVLADSNAILVYLASRYDAERRWLPTDPVRAALVQRWLSAAAGEVAAGPNAARLVKVFGASLDHGRAVAVANRILALIEQRAAGSAFLAGDEPTIADLAVYAYVALAPEGGVPLEPYPEVRSWLARVAALPRFVPMARTPAAA